MKFYRGASKAARAYVERDRSRADDYYLGEGTGVSERLTATPEGVEHAGSMDGETYEHCGADAAVRGLKITGVFFVHDFIEVHMDDVTLTGYTDPFGIIGCQGVGPSSITQLIGKTVEQLSVVEGEFVAIDSGENRLAFPIGGPSAKGPESIRLFRRGHDELGIPHAPWIW
ncbi:hypothetical protein OH802_06485 [Nocardioides sp. NBC_00850]|uniref:hypothetical protein n=1 Tax=Nocardioides sp. NBC_00850 TaxID=2976001 RepID=UPI00386643C7|nr:hypothetical protein OH802_06485 [Nocardioides sp. NBC_00850]